MTTDLNEAVLRELYEMMGGEKMLLEDLTQTFLQDTPSLLADLAAAVQENDANKLVHAAHPLKSSSASMGAMRLSELAAEMESRGKNGQAQGLNSQVEAIQSAYQIASEKLQQFVETL